MFDNKYPYSDFHEMNLDWFLEKFKELVATWEQVQSDWNSLHDFVQNYFDNLDVQTEINNKINAMIADGSFATILTPLVEAALPAVVAGQLPDVVAAQISAVVAAQIDAVVAGQLPAVAAAAAAAEVGDWLAAHIDPDTGYVIDDTLTVSNAAADAKVVGELKSVLSDTTDNMFDLHQMRNASGVTSSRDEFSATAYDLRQAFGISGKQYDISGIEENTQYCFSIMLRTDSNIDSVGLTIAFYYTDGTSATGISVRNNQTNWLLKTYTTTANKTLDYIKFSYTNEGTAVWHLKQIQMTKTAYFTGYKYPNIVAFDDVCRYNQKVLKSVINDNCRYERLGNVSISDNRAYFVIGRNGGMYKIHCHEDLWVSVQGFTDDTYSGTAVYISGYLTDGMDYFIDTENYNLYFRIAYGKTGTITKAEAQACYVEKAICHDPNAYNFYKNVEVVYGEATRRYAYLGVFNGKISVSVDDTVGFGLQGYDTEGYDGTRVVEDGTYYGSHIFDVSGNTNVYYRVIFLKRTSFTTDEILSMQVGIKSSNEDFNNDIDVMAASDMSFLKNIMHGATNQYPANTIGLYRVAKNLGMMCWECDVRPCTDNYVLCHDDDIYNHAVDENGNTIPQGTVLISQHSLAELQQYKFGVITNEQSSGVVEGFETDTIPTLEEFILYAKLNGAIPFIEIKFTPTEQQIIDICNIVKKADMFDKAYFLAFQSASTVAPLLCQHGVKNIGITVSDGSISQANVDLAYSYISPYLNNLDNILIGASVANINETDVNYALSKGFSVDAWTISNTNTDTLKNMFKYGVTLYITNKPNVIRILKDSFYNVQ